ncbi:unnamed protein product [Leptidea sinapis]|uniref:Uncharacterized protein n=1 Tax=Leptidea sinapis TaxID=189913 RepID=A0A5E4QXT5_9NEOP|nr:unnamed protein product [Leptidea sinapis]
MFIIYEFNADKLGSKAKFLKLSIFISISQHHISVSPRPVLERKTILHKNMHVTIILEELLKKLDVDQAAWIGDRAGNYYEVMFPLAAGDNVLPCNVVHSAHENFIEDDEDIISKLTVKQVVDGVRGGGELSFDYLTLIITADSLAALGLVENNASNIVAAMLVSPLMGPVMSITFGTIIADRSLVRSGFESLIIGMLVSLLFGFIFGLILGTTEMPWGYGDWPTEEMKARGNVRSLWMGVLWALTSGTGGLFWALACIWLLYPGVKIPHLKGESYAGNSTYEPLYHDYLPIEFAVNAPYTSSPDLRRFWARDIKVARDANKANLKAEDDERTELILEDLNLATDSNEDIREKLEAAVQEALNDETYRKVKRMSYQSHNADAVARSIGLQARTPTSVRSSVSGTLPPQNIQKGSNIHDIATLDKILTSLLGLQKRRSFRSHLGTPRASRMPTLDELAPNRRSESWPEGIYEDSIVRNVLHSLRNSKQNSASEEHFLTPK